MTVPLLTSPVIPPPFHHGFTTRAGGVSGPPFSSLNVGFKWGDDPACVHENRRRIHEASGAARLFVAHQVHGRDVAMVTSESTPEAIAQTHADALVVWQSGSSVAVMVADCVPVLLADPATGACAAVHAGWRGTAADVAGAAVQAMARITGSSPAQFRAAIGPSIGPCCFEVGNDVVKALRTRVPGLATWLAEDDEWRSEAAARSSHPFEPAVRPRAQVNLWKANEALLLAAGLVIENVDTLGLCTHCNPERFFSYRREGAATGQLMGFIGVND